MSLLFKKRKRHSGLVIAGLAVACVLCGVPAAQAGTLWYNGDMDQRDALANQTSSTAGALASRIYDDFVVPAGHTWTITGVFSNDVADPYDPYGSRTASWEIRSGVSAGNGGTLVASGDGRDTISATGRNFNAFAPFAGTEYTNAVNGLSITLGPGTYWLSVAPDTPGYWDAYWYNSTTSGANAIGIPPGDDGNSYITDSLGNYFTPTSQIEGPGNWDYSMGIVGNFTVTPEPTTMTLLLGGSLSLAGFRYLRRRVRPA